MTEEVKMTKDMAKEAMDGSISHLENELIKIRAGKANPAMLDGIYFDYYGAQTPLNQASNINTLDGKTISVQPWEKNMLEEMEKAIQASNIGINPQNNGEMLILSVPPLTEERRLDLVKQIKSEGENAKVSIRNARKEANDTIKDLQNNSGLSEDMAHDAVAEIQEMTNNYTKKADDLVDAKEKDIMTV